MPKILSRLLAEGKLRSHRTSAREIADLLGVIDRDLADAAVQAIGRGDECCEFLVHPRPRRSQVGG